MHQAKPNKALFSSLALLGLLGCNTTDQAPSPASADHTSLQVVEDRPQDAPPSSCWARSSTPAVIETVTEDVLIAPAQVTPEGIIQKPAQYRTETRPKIVTPRQDHWVQIVCAKDLTPDFVASLQRALAARGLFAGAPSGDMTRQTQVAVRALQSRSGQDTEILLLETAQQLGLVIAPLES